MPTDLLDLFLVTFHESGCWAFPLVPHDAFFWNLGYRLELPRPSAGSGGRYHCFAASGGATVSFDVSVHSDRFLATSVCQDTEAP